jgi:hypothetical protein
VAKEFLGVGWAFPVRRGAGGEVELVAYEEDIEQAIRIILETARGERVMRPDFGSGLHELAFEPVSATTMALVRHRVEQALVEWEPRVEVQEVSVRPDAAEPGRLLVDIRYLVRATNTFYNMVYPFYLREGRER